MHTTNICFGALLLTALSSACAGKAISLGNQAGADAGTTDAAASTTSASADAVLIHASVAVGSAKNDFCRGILLSPHVVLTSKFCLVGVGGTEKPFTCWFAPLDTARRDIYVRYVSTKGAGKQSIPVVNLVDAQTTECGDNALLLELATAADVSEFPTFDAETEHGPGDEIRTFGLGGTQLLNGAIRQAPLTEGPPVGKWPDVAGPSPVPTLYALLPGCDGDSGAPVMDPQGHLIGFVREDWSGYVHGKLVGGACIDEHDVYISPLRPQKALLAQAAAVEARHH